MDLDDIKQILHLVKEHDLAEFELERDGLKVRIRKSGREVTFVPPALPPAALVGIPAPPGALPPPAAVAPVAGSGPEPAEAVELGVIKSPIVGTFYRASEPGAPAF